MRADKSCAMSCSLWPTTCVSALLAAHFLAILIPVATNSPTFDEIGHVASAVSYWDKRTFRLYPHNPPLARLAYGLPIWLSRPNVDYTGVWREHWPIHHRPEFPLGQEFVRANPRDYLRHFVVARIVVAAVSTLGGLVLAKWMFEAVGAWPAVLAVALYSSDPNLLAHGGLATTDAAAAATSVLAGWLWWRFVIRLDVYSAVCAGLGLGLALATKFTALFFVLFWPIGALVFPPVRATPRFAYRLGVGCCAAAGMALVVVNIAYMFEGAFTPLGQLPFLSASLTTPVETLDPLQKGDPEAVRENRFRGSVVGLLPVALPYYMVLGIDRQLYEHEQEYPYYFRGMKRKQGTPWFYVACLVFKEPAATLAVCCLAFWGLAFRRREAALPGWLPAILAAPAVVFGYFSVAHPLCLGIRYILPVIPFLYVGCAAVLSGNRSKRFLQAVIATVVVCNTTALALSQGRYLGFCNALIGSSERKHYWFADSNVDWGQDLFRARRWLELQQPTEPVFMAIWGTIPPDLAGIGEFRLPPVDIRSWPREVRVDDSDCGPQPGVYIVSAQFVKGLPGVLFDQYGKAQFREEDAYAYLQEIHPAEIIGDSLFVYRISSIEARSIRGKLAAGNE